MKKLMCMIFIIQCGFMIAQTKTVVTVYGEKVQINPNSLNTADNGLTATNGNIQLGGALTKPSVLTTTDTWTLAILGLQSGASTDKILTTDANGILRTINPDSMPMWSLLGNTGTNPTTNFLGTTDNQDLAIRTNNVEKMRVTTAGDLIPNGTGLGNLGLATNHWKAVYSNFLDITTGTSSPSINTYPNPNTMVNLNNPNGGSAVISLASSGNGGKQVHMGINPTINVNGEFVIATPTAVNAFDMDLTTGNISMGNVPDPSAILRLNGGGNKGLLLPQSSLSATTTWGLLGTTTQEGMFIYNTNSSITGPGASGKGIYYWNGLQWIYMNDSATSANLNWFQGGNTLTADKTFGTISNNNLPFVTNNTERMRIASTGNVGIGNTVPTNTLHVTSAANPVRFEGLQTTVTPATDLIVMADATGVLKTLDPAALNNGWLLKGNTGTTANPTSTSSNFVGTTDNTALNFRINNTHAGWIGTQTGGPGTSSVYFGVNSGLAAAAITSGAYSNIGIGDNALALNTTNGNIGIGAYALTKSVSGNNNVAMGLYALQNNTSGATNIGIGASALLKNTTGSFNVGIGSNTGITNTTGSNNIFIGNDADTSTDALSNAIAIGYSAKVGQSNSLILGSTGANSVKVGIGNTTPTNTLHVTPVTGVNPVRFDGLQATVTPATDLMVVADANGVLKTALKSDMGDNLGNHTATQDLNMSSKNITAANNITAAGKTATQTAAITKGTDGSTPAANSIAASADASGNVVWKTVSSLVDGSETKVNAGSNVTVTGAGTVASPYVVNATSTADNLGNHIATQNLEMSNKAINNIYTATINYQAIIKDRITSNTSAFNIYKNNGIFGIWNEAKNNNPLTIEETTGKTTVQSAAISKGTDGSAPAVNSVAVSADTNGNVVWKNVSSLVDGSETKVNAGSNVTVTGAGTIASPYVVNATSTADNLGNHTATTDLNMSSKNITAANNITATGKTTTQTAAITKGTDGSTPAANSVAVSADASGNVVWKTISSLVDGSETKVNAGSNVTVTGAGTVASPYVVNATSTADNLGNHTATTDLNMSSKNITAANDITAAGKTTTQNAAITKGTDGSVPNANSVAVSADTNGNIIWKDPSTLVGSQAWALLGNSGTNAATNFLGTKDAQDLALRTNNTEKMRLTTGGSAGIGTSTPNTSARLHVLGGSLIAARDANPNNMLSNSANDIAASVGTAETSILRLVNTSANAANNTALLSFNSYNGSGADWGIGSINNSTTAHDMNFYIGYSNGGGYYKRFNILPNGNVGIGTTTPAATLEVNGTVRIDNLPAGAGSESILTADVSGNVHKVAASSLPPPTTGAGNMTGSNLIMVTNGTNNAFKNSDISLTPGTDKQVLQTVGTTPTWVNASSIAPSITADNGLTASSNNVQLGGSLTKATVLSANATNTLAIQGLQNGAATDDVVVADATGVLKKVSGSSMAIEPWQKQGGTAKATANTDDIYQTGRVAIGTNSMLGTADSNVKLAVNGSIITPTSYYADYVFEDYLDGKSDIKSEYSFKSLDEVEKFITKNKHLPGVTSIKDLQRNEKGEYIFNITDLSIQSLEKIEELYLHTIEQKKQLEANEKNIDEQKKQLEANEKTIKAMSDRIDSLEKLIRENIK